MKRDGFGFILFCAAFIITTLALAFIKAFGG
jgi:hypothetical protein